MEEEQPFFDVTTESYVSILTDALESQDMDSFRSHVSDLFTEDFVNLSVAKQVIARFCEVAAGPKAVEATRTVISVLDSRAALFDSILWQLHVCLAGKLEDEGQFADAAAELVNSQIHTGDIRAPERAEVLLNLVSLYIKLGDLAKAEAAAVEASALSSEVPLSVAIKMKYASAQTVDLNGEFLDAAARYYAISRSNEIAASARVESLYHSAKCALVGPAGPQRSRVLGTLLKDDRIRDFGGYSMLIKCYEDRILSPEDAHALRGILDEHQCQGDRLQQAVMQHNIISATRLYGNITFSELARMLSVTDIEAEDLVAKMIREKRLAGSIDQSAHLLKFAGGDNPHKTWNIGIENVCDSVNSIVERIAQDYPDLVRDFV